MKNVEKLTPEHLTAMLGDEDCDVRRAAVEIIKHFSDNK